MAVVCAHSEERLSGVAHTGQTGDGDLRLARGEAGPDPQPCILRGDI